MHSKAERVDKSQGQSILFTSDSSLIFLAIGHSSYLIRQCKAGSDLFAGLYKPDFSGFACVDVLSLCFYSLLF